MVVRWKCIEFLCRILAIHRLHLTACRTNMKKSLNTFYVWLCQCFNSGSVGPDAIRTMISSGEEWIFARGKNILLPYASTTAGREPVLLED